MFEMIGMSNLSFRYKSVFGGGKKPDAPKPAAPIPQPVALDDNVKQADRDRRRAKIAAAGRGGTILTQGQTLSSGNSSLLGRTTS